MQDITAEKLHPGVVAAEDGVVIFLTDKLQIKASSDQYKKIVEFFASHYSERDLRVLLEKK